ncbi:glycosyltransferase [Moritella viscosa]|uniref:WfeX n=1 Tax=Moritella viscosa TaxID=80854 RepID=A0A090IGD6_9GAMM|nr:glycosyltransferase [Moritella viscosa]CED61665.1 putative glycosyl transferase [Moritella viscosa]SGY90188.1 WfeX [Moritella viscosa]SGY98651.1 WfeX [Moritella viscosa]SGY99151.1 WfeX [Moritella viscosa]SHO05394.1 WfeX [Moritella viscosa]
MQLKSIIENISDEYGGPANSLPNFLEAIRSELGVESVIYSTINSIKDKNEFIDRFSIPWVRCKLNGMDKLKYSKEMKSRLLSTLTDGDVLFSNNLWNYPAFLAAKLSQEKKVPHIVSIRGTLYPWSLAQGKLRKKLAWLLFQKKSLQQANLIHVTCADEYKAVRELNITSPIAIVPHGINYDDYQDLPNKINAIEHLRLNNNKKYVLFMSRLHKKKGLDILLEIWPEVAKDFPNWCLLIVGPDYSNYNENIAELAVENGTEDNIKVFGMLSGYDKKCVLASSEFFILPSYTENFGVVIGEALAAGLPSITTTGTPWSEINTHNCGKYITLSRENVLQSLQEMMTLDKHSLDVMSNNSKLLIKNNYSWSAQAIKFGKALDFVLTGEPAPDVVYLQDENPPTNIV